MLLFYDTKNNIIKDEEQFDNEHTRKMKAKITNLFRYFLSISLI